MRPPMADICYPMSSPDFEEASEEPPVYLQSPRFGLPPSDDVSFWSGQTVRPALGSTSDYTSSTYLIVEILRQEGQPEEALASIENEADAAQLLGELWFKEYYPGIDPARDVALGWRGYTLAVKRFEDILHEIVSTDERYEQLASRFRHAILDLYRFHCEHFSTTFYKGGLSRCGVSQSSSAAFLHLDLTINQIVQIPWAKNLFSPFLDHVRNPRSEPLSHDQTQHEFDLPWMDAESDDPTLRCECFTQKMEPCPGHELEEGCFVFFRDYAQLHRRTFPPQHDLMLALEEGVWFKSPHGDWQLDEMRLGRCALCRAAIAEAGGQRFLVHHSPKQCNHDGSVVTARNIWGAIKRKIRDDAARERYLRSGTHKRRRGSQATDDEVDMRGDTGDDGKRRRGYVRGIRRQESGGSDMTDGTSLPSRSSSRSPPSERGGVYGKGACERAGLAEHLHDSTSHATRGRSAKRLLPAAVVVLLVLHLLVALVITHLSADDDPERDEVRQHTNQSALTLIGGIAHTLVSVVCFSVVNFLASKSNKQGGLRVGQAV